MKTYKDILIRFRGQIKDQVEDQVWNQAWLQMDREIWDQVWDRARTPVFLTARSQVWGQIRRQESIVNRQPSTVNRQVRPRAR